MFPSIELSLGRPGCRCRDARSQVFTRLRRVFGCNFSSAFVSGPLLTHPLRDDPDRSLSGGARLGKQVNEKAGEIGLPICSATSRSQAVPR